MPSGERLGPPADNPTAPDTLDAVPRLVTGVTSSLAVALLVAVPGVHAAAPAYAPLDRQGPALSVAPAELAGALHCQSSVAHAAVEPVLLSPATSSTDEQNYSWNWEPALTRLGIPWCAYTAPQHTLGDVQVSGEYLVYAIRTMSTMAGRRIAVMGHSQGGMSMRWALRFWPDTRAMVDDVIGFSATNHGSTVKPSCTHGCPAAIWQQSDSAAFIDALNSYTETFAGISYTEIYTHTDEVVQPNSGPNASAALHTGAGQITNVATQDICPGDGWEHLAVGTVDPVAYALAVDALTHPGPADPARIDSAVCGQLLMPGVDPINLQTGLQILAALPGQLAVAVGGINLLGIPEITAEPPLACYVFASCQPAAPASAPVRARAPRRRGCVTGRRLVLRVRAAGVRSLMARVGRRRLRVALAGGTYRLPVRLAARGTTTVRIRIARRGGRSVVLVRRYRTCARSRGGRHHRRPPGRR